MRESLDNALEELKRADHLIYVSLKYTRTVDVIKSIVERLLNAYHFGIESLLLFSKKKGKLDEISKIPRVRADILKKIYPDDDLLNDFMELYIILRKINKAEYEKAREFRRHVTMTAYLEDTEVEIDIDIITDYFSRTKEFIEYVALVLEPPEK